MKPIGGYFGLHAGDGSLPHPKAYPVNFGRGGLGLILRARKYRRVWIPDFICPCVPQFLDRLGVIPKTYAIDGNLEPAELPRLANGDAFLYVNYFGVKNTYCRRLEKVLSTSLILTPQPQPTLPYVSNYMIYSTRSGTFSRLAFDPAFERDNLLEVHCTAKPGDAIHAYQNTSHSLGTILFKASSLAEIQSITSNIEKYYQVVVE